MADRDPVAAFVALLERMTVQQQAKLLASARVRVPHLTEDDLKQPHDFPALDRDPVFQYEDGVLAGMRMALSAVRARDRSES